MATDIATGLQQLLAGWERPEGAPDDWEIDESEVTASVEDALTRFDVWRMYGDPPYWTDTMGFWHARHPDQIEEWWTNRHKLMAYVLREYVEEYFNEAFGEAFHSVRVRRSDRRLRH